MRQLVQNFKTGELKLEEVPLPQILPHKLLVRTEYSVISMGTERVKIVQAKMSYLGKAKAKPQELIKVIDSLKRDGPVATYRKVMNKLDSLTPLGYSSAGEVIGVGEEVLDFSAGDKVACAGEGASHSEIESIYPNLCVKIPRGVTTRQAAFTTIGSIALQGVRRADIHLGETVAVIGLGLIGQLTVQLLKISGCKVLGIDIRQSALELAIKSGADRVALSGQEDILEVAKNFSNGFGVDVVIITAESSSLEPINLAGRLCRKKARVVVVGAVPTGFSREDYYKKELDLVMSCSYGPGRYDNTYEQKGVDYPIGYVRWTEKRNMQAFLTLLAEEKINLGHIITHVFRFEDAIEAYKMLESKDNDALTSILLEYDVKKEIEEVVSIIPRTRKRKARIIVAMIGAGNFARNYLLPNLVKIPALELRSVVTASGLSARDAARKFGFRNALSTPDAIFKDDEINLVMIAARHSLHSEYVIKALRSGKNVFVEKPLCLNKKELEDIVNAYNASSESLLFVGFNRRFSPLSVKVKEFFKGRHGPLSVICRINALPVSPGGSWIQDIDEGGRIVGEVCHFIDLARYWIGFPIKELFAYPLRTEGNGTALTENVHIMLTFEDGSVASIQYLANGASAIPKEYYEVFAEGKSAILNDFKTLTLAKGNKQTHIKTSQNKGHQQEISHLISTLRNVTPLSLSAEEIFQTTRATFAILESIKNNKRIKL